MSDETCNKPFTLGSGEAVRCGLPRGHDDACDLSQAQMVARRQEFTRRVLSALDDATHVAGHGARDGVERARTIAYQEGRMRTLAARHVRSECIDELLIELAHAIDDGTITNGQDDDTIERWFAERVAREPSIARVVDIN